MSTDAATLPDALSDAARSFAAGPHRMVIGAERLESSDGRTFETFDPATGRVITEVPHAGTDDVDRAVRAAREAFENGSWSGIAAAERTRAMLAFADAIDANTDELAQLESLDNGKPVKMAKPRGRAARRRAHPLLRGLAHAHHRRGAARGNAEHALLHPQGARGRGRADHPVELPAADGRLEGGARARGRLHDRAEAGRADAAHGAAARRARARGRASPRACST